MSKKNKSPFEYWLLLIPVVMFCLLGLLIGSMNGSPVTGILWGAGIAAVIIAAVFIGDFGWEWLQKEMNKGKLFPYITTGILIAVAVSGYFAFTLGDPSCEEYDSNEPRSSCIQYADNGFKASNEQRWNEFWSKLPVTAVIASLVATLVHHNIHRKK